MPHYYYENICLCRSLCNLSNSKNSEVEYTGWKTYGPSCSDGIAWMVEWPTDNDVGVAYHQTTWLTVLTTLITAKKLLGIMLKFNQDHAELTLPWRHWTGASRWRGRTSGRKPIRQLVNLEYIWPRSVIPTVAKALVMWIVLSLNFAQRAAQRAVQSYAQRAAQPYTQRGAQPHAQRAAQPHSQRAPKLPFAKEAKLKFGLATIPILKPQ